MSSWLVTIASILVIIIIIGVILFFLARAGFLGQGLQGEATQPINTIRLSGTSNCISYPSGTLAVPIISTSNTLLLNCRDPSIGVSNENIFRYDTGFFYADPVRLPTELTVLTPIVTTGFPSDEPDTNPGAQVLVQNLGAIGGNRAIDIPWIIENDGTIKYAAAGTNVCLAANGNNTILATCNPQDSNQKWVVTRS